MSPGLVRAIIVACTRAEAEWARGAGERGRIFWVGIGWVCHLARNHEGECKETPCSET